MLPFQQVYAGLSTYKLSGESIEITKSGITSVDVGDFSSAELTIINASSDVNPTNSSSGV
jgi:hypothetical protein